MKFSTSLHVRLNIPYFRESGKTGTTILTANKKKSNRSNAIAALLEREFKSKIADQNFDCE